MADADVIMFIRHAEKPGEDGPPHGIDHDGERNPHALSVRGWTRAGALAGLFAHDPQSLAPPLVVPERVIATKSTDDYKSKREVNTASPLAQRLNLSVEKDFDHSQTTQLRDSLLADRRPAIVVWHHHALADVVRAFPVHNLDAIPATWPSDRFDLIWVLVREPDASAFTFSVVPQNLLDGDVTHT